MDSRDAAALGARLHQSIAEHNLSLPQHLTTHHRQWSSSAHNTHQASSVSSQGIVLKPL